MKLTEMEEWRKRLRIGDYVKLNAGEHAVITDISILNDDVVFSVRYMSETYGGPCDLMRIGIWYFKEPMTEHEITIAKLQGLV